MNESSGKYSNQNNSNYRYVRMVVGCFLKAFINYILLYFNLTTNIKKGSFALIFASKQIIKDFLNSMGIMINVLTSFSTCILLYFELLAVLYNMFGNELGCFKCLLHYFVTGFDVEGNKPVVAKRIMLTIFFCV